MLNPEDIEPPFGVGRLDVDGVEYVAPFLRCNYGEGEIELHWGNATIRAFHFDDTMNHVETRIEGKLKGIRMGQDIMDLMIKYGYPMRVDPVPDEATVDWFLSMEMSELDRELDELGEDGL